jgi:hypothetical protein
MSSLREFREINRSSRAIGSSGSGICVLGRQQHLQPFVRLWQPPVLRAHPRHGAHRAPGHTSTGPRSWHSRSK